MAENKLFAANCNMIRFFVRVFQILQAAFTRLYLVRWCCISFAELTNITSAVGSGRSDERRHVQD